MSQRGRFLSLASVLTFVLLLALGLGLALMAFMAPAAQAQGTATAVTTATGSPTSGVQTVPTGTPLATLTAPATGTARPTGTAAATGTARPTVAAAGGTLQPAPTASPLAATTPLAAYRALTGTVPAVTNRTITVIGDGKVSTQPDIAYANIGVEVVTGTVRAASTQAQATMDALLVALRAQGIADRDIQTSGFNIFMERMPGPDGRPGTNDQIRYHVSNQVQVTIRSLDRVSAVLDAAIGAGANNIFGVNFAVSNQRQAETQAYRSAMEDARGRADYLASLAGLRVAGVVSISEVASAGPVLLRGDVGTRAMGGGGGGPISPGELEVSRQVQVIFALQ